MPAAIEVIFTSVLFLEVFPLCPTFVIPSMILFLTRHVPQNSMLRSALIMAQVGMYAMDRTQMQSSLNRTL